eukprot:464942-Pelagomonas_calceolata.AAC.3
MECHEFQGKALKLTPSHGNVDQQAEQSNHLAEGPNPIATHFLLCLTTCWAAAEASQTFPRTLGGGDCVSGEAGPAGGCGAGRGFARPVSVGVGRIGTGSGVARRELGREYEFRERG